jgi:hypothetical protein
MRVGVGNVENAGCDARIARVVLAFALLQHEDAAAELGCAISGRQAGNAGADDGEINCGRHEARP